MLYTKNKLNILIIDDHKVMVDGIGAILTKKIIPIPKILGATNIEQAWELIANHLVELDLILIDLDIPNTEGKRLAGLDLAIEIQEEYEELKLIIISNEKKGETILKSFRHGIMGYIGKSETTGGDILVRAIEEVLIRNNRFYIGEIRDKMDQALINKDNKSIDKLKDREIELIRFIANGYAGKVIAGKLGISESTMDRVKKDAMLKLEAHNAAHLVAKAFVYDIISRKDIA